MEPPRPQVVIPLNYVRYHRWPDGMEKPSQREIEIIRLIARGMSNDEVGQQLFISGDTVKTHLRRTTKKLKMRRGDRGGLVALCFRYGFLTPDSVWPEEGEARRGQALGPRQRETGNRSVGR